ncbi:MAG: cytochrome P450 [Flavobacteriaceae bacterium]
MDVASIKGMPLEDIDPSDQTRFVDWTLFEVFDRIRKERPVCYHKNTQYGPFWSITKYKDIMEAELDHKTFSSDAKYGGIWIKEQPQETIRKSFMVADPPVHDEQRKVVNPIVSPANLQRMEEFVRAETNDILDGLPLDTEIEWVDAMSVELTGRVLARLMDFPFEDRRLLTEWSDLVNLDLKVGGEITDEFKKYEALAPCGAYFRRLYEERKELPPQHDLVSMLAHASNTCNMNDQELRGMIILLMVGGNDTTRNTISGGVVALNEFPHEYEKLRANPALVESMVPEMIRWVSPVAHMRRTATSDTEFKGEKIKKGDKVILWYISGNRDEEMIEDPYNFIIDRKNPRQHVSFGFGVHRCFGNRLAEMQLRVFWEEMLKRNLVIETLGPPKRRFSNFVIGIDELPVKLRKA